MLRRLTLGLLAATVGLALAACGVVATGGSTDAAPTERDATTSASPGDGDTGPLDSVMDAGRTADTGPPTTRGDGAMGSAGPILDAGTCGAPFDARVDLPDGGACSARSCSHLGFGECCPGYACAACAVPTGDGGWVFDVEAGPFFCNVTMR